MTNSQVKQVYLWTVNNRLALNTNKTNAMLFTNRIHDVATPSKFVVDGMGIDLVECTKFLGMQIDFTLNFSNHITFVCTKLSKTVGLVTL